jgi:photoactive yellow protein
MTTSTSTFVPASVLESLGSLTAAQADALPFGVVKLDSKGIIQLYNRYNYENFANFGGKSVIGRNYFTEVAPCANNFIFSGRFMRGAEMGMLDQVFDYVFTYKIEPTRVRVHLYHHKASGTNWIFVRKI